MGSFDRGMAAALPVGSVIQSPLNLESMTNGQWIALDGRDCNRSDYPLIQSQFPAGVFTSTARTLSVAPSAAVICADSTNFMAIGAASLGLQASPDGVTWTNQTGWAIGITSMIVAGSRIVAASSAPYVTPINQTAANVTNAANWTATTGGTTTTLTQGLAYSSSQARTVLCNNGGGLPAAYLYYMNDGGTTWTAATTGSATSLSSPAAVVWTGQKFIVFGSSTDLIHVSTDGITWNNQVISLRANSVISAFRVAASDGNGTVVAHINIQYHGNGGGSAEGFLVSKDHGNTWRFVSGVSVNLKGQNAGLQYVNGKFISHSSSDGGYGTLTAVSSDGLSWLPAVFWQAGIAGATLTGLVKAVAFKNGTYCAIRAGATNAYTVTENMAKFTLHIGSDLNIAPYVGAAPANSYIKVRN